MDDDCFAARLAAGFRRRFGPAAADMAATRLARAHAHGVPARIDLYMAVSIILHDPAGVFARSRAMAGSATCRQRAPLRPWN